MEKKTNPDPTQPPPGMPGDLLHDVRALGGYRLLRQLGEGGMGAVISAITRVRTSRSPSKSSPTT